MEHQQNKHTLLRYLPVIIGCIVGAIGGFLYYRYVGCATGACMITGNPYISTIYGSVFGALLGSLFVRSGKKSVDSETVES